MPVGPHSILHSLTSWLPLKDREKSPPVALGTKHCRYLTKNREENVAFLSRRLNIPVQTCRVSVLFLPGETMRGRNRLKSLSSPVGMRPFYGSAPSIMPRMEGGGVLGDLRGSGGKEGTLPLSVGEPDGTNV